MAVINDKDTISSLTTEDVCSMLNERIDEISETTVDSFRSAKINGKAFLSLTEEDFKELGCTLGERKLGLALVASFKPHVRII